MVFCNQKCFSVRGVLFLFTGLALFMTACRSGGSKSDCPTAPSAIFSDGLEGVGTHDFMQNGAEGLEVVSFSNGVFLEIFQSGCDSLRQEFRFRLPSAEPGEAAEEEPGFWLQEAQNQFRALGALGPDFLPFSQWADALATRQEQFRLAEPMQVETGFWMMVDKIESFDGPTLVVVLSNKEL